MSLSVLLTVMQMHAASLPPPAPMIADDRDLQTPKMIHQVMKMDTGYAYENLNNLAILKRLTEERLKAVDKRLPLPPEVAKFLQELQLRAQSLPKAHTLSAVIAARPAAPHTAPAQGLGQIASQSVERPLLDQPPPLSAGKPQLQAQQSGNAMMTELAQKLARRKSLAHQASSAAGEMSGALDRRDRE